VETEVEPLSAYLNDYPRWVAPAFAPLAVTPLDHSHYQLSLPAMGGLGLVLTPDLLLHLFQDRPRIHEMSGQQAGSNLSYSFNLSGCLELSPQLRWVAISWQVKLGVNLGLPPLLRHLPNDMVTHLGNQILQASSSAVGDRFLHQLLAQYQAPYQLSPPARGQ